MKYIITIIDGVHIFEVKPMKNVKNVRVWVKHLLKSTINNRFKEQSIKYNLDRNSYYITVTL